MSKDSEVSRQLIPLGKRPARRRASGAEHMHRARRRFLQRLGIVIFLWLAHRALEPSGLVARFERLAAEFVQDRLSATRNDGNQSVMVVDITSLPLSPPKSGGNKDLVTPRAALTDVIEKIAKSDPLAIGIDVYFEPDNKTGRLPTEDEDFLDLCLNLKGTHGQQIPTFVGINGSAGWDPAHWLGFKRFEPLGKEIIIPNSRNQYPSGVRFDDHIQVSVNGKDISAQSMSDALSEAAQEKRETKKTDKRWVGQMLSVYLPKLVISRSDVDQDGVKERQFQVDFGLIKWLIAHKVPSDSLPNEVLRDKVVLVGRATESVPTDMFTIPGYAPAVPGVFEHAAAVDTLLDSPLYTLTKSGVFALDVLEVLVPLGCLFLFEWRWPKLMKESAFGEEALAFLVVVLLWVFAYGLVGKIGIYWTGFLPVCMSLLIRIPGENRLEWLVRKVYGKGSV